MTTELPQNDIEAFYVFLGRRLEQGSNALTPEESLHEFRAYQDELCHLRSKLATSHQEFVDGAAKELDTDALMDRVRARLAQQEISD